MDCKPITELQNVTFHVRSHSVTCNLTRMNVPRLNPSHALDLPTPEGWKAELTLLLVIYRDRWFTCPQTVTHPSSNHLIATWLGVEPTTSRSQVQCLNRYTTKPPGEIETPGFVYDSVEFLVFCEQISCRWVKRFPSKWASNRCTWCTHLRNCYFSAISSYSMRTVADRHRLVAYYKMHCWRAFRWYQHRWPWTTVKSKNSGVLMYVSRF